MKQNIILNKKNFYESQRQITDAFIDVSNAKQVDVEWREDGTVLWVNVNGVCLLRICKIDKLYVGEKK